MPARSRSPGVIGRGFDVAAGALVPGGLDGAAAAPREVGSVIIDHVTAVATPTAATTPIALTVVRRVRRRRRYALRACSFEAPMAVPGSPWRHPLAPRTG
ncbi:hypothetical protein RZO50_03100 [Microbacterium sp. SSW1-59]|uniref:hypothetical protein n=1 Tax=Microbacterium xanthum TaxID=3079794 RepID=UPI002AD344DB|nr:hypothetical protein [Microbacterium sp. SSW1-59]MDZ8200482.1 hypothetical protein [Microbacterium sp. SSW1-59]